ncbi:ubiquitin-binding protein cue5 [Agyrium rufum]|nr:ubiquitin-binding protein cue5 [Agyrium rufum]
MADAGKPKVEGPPESPTTAREPDFNDEPLDDPSSPRGASKTGPTIAEPKPSTTPGTIIESEVPPPQQPRRPLSPRQQAENTLKEAFPSIDANVVKAVLTASGGHVEPAFNALLSMTDPSVAQQDEAPPPQPPRRPQQTQLEADEAYARRLAEQYNGSSHYERGSSDPDAPRLPRRKKETGLKPSELYDDRDRSFIDDDLPEIRDNIKKGFFETQTKVTNFIKNLQKKMNEEDEEDEHLGQGPSMRVPGQQQRTTPRRSGEYGGRRSTDHHRYDADPELLDDNFERLQMRDETASSNHRSHRPLANPDLFKPTPAAPRRSTDNDGRRVSFQEGPSDEINDSLYGDNDPPKRPTSSASRSKWQPLASVDPAPMADHDPFALGESDDEGEAVKKVGETAKPAMAGTGTGGTKTTGVGEKLEAKP